MQSLEAAYPTEPTCETADPDFQVSWQKDTEHDSNREHDFEMGDIKRTLVIEPTHPSNSGAYYCATADDVAQLIVKTQGDFFFVNVFSILAMTNSLCSFKSVFLFVVTMQS